MEAKKIVAVVGAIDVVLLVVCLVLYLGKDRKGPEIFFDEERQIEYTEGMDEALLLEGVTAVDEKDGDVSDSLLVEDVYKRQAQRRSGCDLLQVRRQGLPFLQRLRLD